MSTTQKKHKIRGQEGRGLGHVTYCSILGPPSISQEQLKLETWNLVCR